LISTTEVQLQIEFVIKMSLYHCSWGQEKYTWHCNKTIWQRIKTLQYDILLTFNHLYHWKTKTTTTTKTHL